MKDKLLNLKYNLLNLGLKFVCSGPVQKILRKVFSIDPEDFKLGFVKIEGIWYSDIKNWPERLRHRQMMVAGADRLLEDISEGFNYITLHIKKKDFPDAWHLSKIDESEWGGTYICDTVPYQIWICNVTKFVFGCHPHDIYFKVVDRKNVDKK